jgi:hypothetical protein
MFVPPNLATHYTLNRDKAVTPVTLRSEIG